jgi:hypothetical protein
MQEFNQLLQVVAQRLGLDKKTQEFGVLSVWNTIVPPAYQSKAQARSVFYKGKRAVLRVQVNHPITATELAFEREDLLSKLNRYTPQTGIHLSEIEFRVGSVA